MASNGISYLRLTLIALAGIFLVAGGYALHAGRSEARVYERSREYLQKKINSLEGEVLTQIEDSAFLFRAMEETAQFGEFLARYTDKPYAILVFREGELKIWSDNGVIPANINRIFKEKFNFVKINNGYYEVIRKDYHPGVVALGIIPVYYSYPIVNRYLQEGFNFQAPVLERIKISNNANEHAIRGYDGRDLFYFELSGDAKAKCFPLFWLMQLLGMILLVAAAVRVSAALARSVHPAVGLGSLLILFGSLMAAHFSPYLLYTKYVELFSPRIYASSAFIPSLGILLLFSLACLTVVLFIYRYIKLPVMSRKGTASDIYLVLFYLFNAVLFIATALIIISIAIHSTISFDFYNFYSLSIYSVAGLAVFSIWFAILFAAFNKAALVSRNVPVYKIIAVAAATAPAVFLVMRSTAELDPMWMAIFYLLFFAQFTLSERGAIRFTFINYLLIAAIFAWMTSNILTAHINFKQFDKQKDFIAELLFERNLSEEYLMMEAGGEIQTDNFIKRHYMSPFLGGYDLGERLKESYFSSFENRYNIYIYTFNSSRLPLEGELEKDFDYLNDLYRNKAHNTVSPNIRYFSGEGERLKYLLYYPVYDNETMLGHLFVEVVPKIFGSSSAYPELLIAESGKPLFSEDEFEYAIYRHGRLQNSRGDYEYTASLIFDAGEIGEYNFYNDRDYNHLVYNSDESTVVVLSKKKRSIISPFSAFSYSFCFYLLAMLLLWAGGLGRLLLNQDQLSSDQHPVTLQRRIQVAMISLVLSSLFIIGVVTLVYFQNQYESYHNDRLLRKAKALENNIDAYIQAGFQDPEDRDTVLTEAAFEMILKPHILTLAKIHSMDFNIYHRNGSLMFTSQPDIFNKELVSRMIDPNAILNLRNKGKSRFVQDERVGMLIYLSAYIPYRNSAGDKVAILHFPYYSKQQSLRADISYFLVALVNVYVLLILTATAIALVLSRSITNSLTIIQERLSSIKLREKNVPIEWKNKDEIGMLVDEYNRMIQELEKSAELLARSERETAWREMAKQVAHEIKNPLTPMKLSIQHLQRALKEGRPDVRELTEQVSSRLIEQIDNLTHIASEFSSFASMPVAQLQKVDLKEIVMSAAALFQNLQHLSVFTDVPDHPCWVKADKNQMIGVFNNLLKNASQAISEDGDGRVNIRLIDKQDVFRVEIEDNGVGIPAEKQARVFEPNFTTKSSGTGLGLAISKNIMEKSKGSIWFESEPGKGTIFYLVLPKFEE